MKWLFRRAWVQRLCAIIIWRYLAFALRSTRWRLEGAENIPTKPCITAFWHERLPLIPMLWIMTSGFDTPRRVHVLVSRHRDGRFIGDIVRHFAIGVVHGSSSKGGPGGMRRMLDLLGEGSHVAITPDGPRGPRRRAAAGVAQLAALAGAPVFPCSAQISRKFTLRSWDRMVVPLPFGRGAIICGAPILVPREGWECALPAIEAAMTDAADQADRLCAR
jgi:lysophospholipid acyltransferase (LPLAT)-like uncharacterized protein